MNKTKTKVATQLYNSATYFKQKVLHLIDSLAYTVSQTFSLPLSVTPLNGLK